VDDATLAARFKLPVEEVPARLKESHDRLLFARGRRIRPGTDDKILTAWNGLMLAAISEAARALQQPQLTQRAARCAEFLLKEMRPGGKLRRSWREGKTTNEVFLEDYAALILGLLELYQTDFDVRWFRSARELTDEMIEKFGDPAGGFFDTPNDGEMLLIRPKDIQDNATPSGNALACDALLKMAEFTGNGAYRDHAENALGSVALYMLRAPLGFARWLSAGRCALEHIQQVAVIGEDGDAKFGALVQTAQAGYNPYRIVAAAAPSLPSGAPEVLRDRGMVNGTAAAYVCEGFVCKNPVTSADELATLL
jgi:uncharacterized protein YyaL (SSP411 family)